MKYFAIKGIAGGSLAYAVHPQNDTSPTLRPSHHEIFDATLFKHRGDALNSLGEMPHKLATQCTIVEVEIPAVENH
jgi:hypothetical protein